jgi:hypothetical protein
VNALLLDAGALIAIDRGDRTTWLRIEAAERNGFDVLTHAMVLAQVWRDATGRQARLARALEGVNVRSVGERLGREAGLLLARSGTDDPIDAALVLLASDGDRILTSDVTDIERLAMRAGKTVDVMPC